jgi:predicted dehydrogenase
MSDKTDRAVARGAIVGLGKMGLSHQAMLNAHPDVDLVGICDSSGYLLGILGKYTDVATYSNFEKMLDEARPDFVLIATPSSLHAHMVQAAIDRGIHVFCEKPFCLTEREGAELAAAAQAKGLVTQVGYHNRFVGAFQEVKRLLAANAIGDVTHVLAEAYGPVVLRPSGGTWRSKSSEGGGCLYDYAAHPINLVNWYLGTPTGVGGTVLNRIFSREIDDEVSSTLYYSGGRTAQISVNWSDESVRKMTTRITLWGTGGRIFADRQECQVYLRNAPTELDGYRQGWNVKYTTELTEPVGYYLRGEEYSAQIDHFVSCVRAGKLGDENDFGSAVVTDQVIELMIADAAKGAATTSLHQANLPAPATPPALSGRPARAAAQQLAAQGITYAKAATDVAKEKGAAAVARYRSARANRKANS